MGGGRRERPAAVTPWEPIGSQHPHLVIGQTTRCPSRDSEERTVRLVELQQQLRNELLDEGRPNSVIRLAEQLFAAPVVTAARVEASIGVTRPTAHAAIDALVERGDLVEVTGRERRRIYEAPRIFEAVYGSVDVEDQ